MADLGLSAAKLGVALFLVVLNGFFVAAEFAFVRVRATSVEQLVEEGRAGAGALQDVMVDLDNYLAVTQLGITLASLGLGWAGEPAVAGLIEPVLGSFLPETFIHLVAVAIGFTVITFLHVVFGELAPKTFAIAQTERISLYLAPPMKVFYYLFYPGIVVFNGAANAFTAFLGVPPASESDETLGEREIRRVLAQSGEEGDIDVAEVAMIERVFELDDTTVREVMIPQPDVVSVAADATLSELRDTVFEAGHTRYPVVEADDRTQVIGFVDVKDLLQASEREGEGTTTASDLARDILIVPETTTINDLLVQFRSEHRQMAAVIDEWGAFEGIATVEDVVEAVVGDLRDEFDVSEREPSIRRREDGSYDVDGGVSLAALNDVLDAEFEHPAVETAAGLVLNQLDRAPEVGDRVEVDKYGFEVTGVDGSRISSLRIFESGSDETN
ncbi:MULTISPECIES: hemolysin family protein [unclassified Halobacterium]|jgi:CBS domain containing-hemolysin-like protein|uniref:hemolysin family protein n=1 Tax=unclassified Halobacterium TaxID=2668073 RepID=UPI001E4E4366|nr:MULTISPECIES: hemolysin family protein [unclassified Halobacterium]MCD2201117.1 hemolysin family protein [Halobacterium sp. KA-4]MCD2203309.1 hemolysin family protein [Halobacterium sp. KA-6]